MFRVKVYAVILRPDMKSKFLQQMMRDADVLWHFMCLGASAPKSADFLVRRRFSERDPGPLAEEADWFAVGTYDGEGYVVWRSSSQPQKQREESPRIRRKQ